MITSALIVERLERVRERIATAAAAESVTIVAVTKGFGPDAVSAAVDAGLEDFGENYAHELISKRECARDARWHYLGAVQRRKVRALAPHVAVWQGVDRPEEGVAIASHQPGARVLVQVNVSGEPQKAGCSWGDVDALVGQLRRLDLDVRGLMAVGPAGPPERARAGFERLAAKARALGLDEVSMGMSADLEVAVAAGATMVRVGTALFGPRPPANHGVDDLRR